MCLIIKNVLHFLMIWSVPRITLRVSELEELIALRIYIFLLSNKKTCFYLINESLNSTVFSKKNKQ